jgi:putative transcriptional regulator
MSSLAGSFLVARPVIQDSHFRHTVVLLVQHGEEGAFGLVVNRPTSVEGLPFPVFSGGPCQAPGLLMIHGHADWVESAEELPKNQVAPGIFLGDSSCVSRVSDAEDGPDLRYRMFVGYAGWGPRQLESELAQGAWAVVTATGDVLFETPAESIWQDLLPPAIPQPSLN